MAITVTPPTMPPAMAPVFELLPKESEKVGKDDDNAMVAGKSVEVREEPIGLVVTELGEPINEPGSILELSETVGLEQPKKC